MKLKRMKGRWKQEREREGEMGDWEREREGEMGEGERERAMEGERGGKWSNTVPLIKCSKSSVISVAALRAAR